MSVHQEGNIYMREILIQPGRQRRVLLLDSYTIAMVNASYAHYEWLEREEYLFERIDNISPREPIKHLNCIVFLRPTEENINRLCQELRDPKYAEYYIYFSSYVNEKSKEKIAEADEHGIAPIIQHYNLDIITLSHQLFSLGMTDVFDPEMRLSTNAFLRSKEGIISLLLALRRVPAICYQKSKDVCEKLADEITQVIRREEALFRGAKEKNLLIILDRSEDPVTPLLTPWTYEAMVHELVGINNNRVTIDGNSIVLSEFRDDFFAKNFTSNVGELWQKIKVLMEEFQNKAKIHKNVESMADMKNFVEEYPQFKKISGTVSKHVAVLGELSKIVDNQNLLEISELEQLIVAGGDHSRCLEKLRVLLQHPKTTRLIATRLILLYALRFETDPNNDIKGLISSQRSYEQELTHLVKSILSFGSDTGRSNDLFGGQSAVEMTKRVNESLEDVHNQFYRPSISKIVYDIARNNFDNKRYPLHGDEGIEDVDRVIIFMIGGITYGEAAIIHAFNEKRKEKSGGPVVMLASTHMWSTQSFIKQLEMCASVPSTGM